MVARLYLLFIMKKIISVFLAIAALSSCATKLLTTSIVYQSIRTRHAQPTSTNPIPEEAKMAVAYYISKEGKLTAVVYNRTSEIMTIDQTKSFFVNSNGVSTSYYDPTVRTTSTTDVSTSTRGASVNLGSIASALGVGGVIGDIANGVNVGGSGTNGTATTNTTYVSDMPQVSIAPYGNGAMSKVFVINGIGGEALVNSTETVKTTLAEDQSYCKFSVCISYSFDEGKTYERLVSNFYANSKVVVPVTTKGQVNEPLRKLYATKPDAVNENCWIMMFDTRYGDKGYSQGVLYDYN